MNNFPQPPIDNMGGLSFFKFLEVEGVAEFPYVINNEINDDISLNSDYSWADGYSSAEKLEYSENSKTSDNGKYLESLLKGSAPYSEDFHKLFESMNNRRFIIHFSDSDGNERIAGTDEQPLTFSYNFTTQTESGVKSYTYKFSGNIRKSAPIYKPSSSGQSTT